MTEIIQCPGCSTRFSLPTGRVHAGIQRAKCFRCETIFEIGEAVARLLATLTPEAGAEADRGADDPGVAPGAALVPELEAEFEAGLAFDLEADLEPGVPPAEAAALPATPPAPPAPAEASPFADLDAPPSLTLGDLEGTEEEIMEKTLVIPPLEPPEELPEPEEAASAGGYSSAKDAIARLMGNTPAATPVNNERRQMGSRTSMDVEATLNALDSTLSGTQPLPTGPPPPPPPQLSEPNTSTMKLSIQEIQAAMAAFNAKLPTPPPAPRFTPPPPRAEMPPPPRPFEPPPTSQGADLLKVQVGQEMLNNVNLDQITTWIEQGRVQEYHMVARQYSDNWIEAIKVPALRPVFERMRRLEAGLPADMPTPPPDLAPPKRSLFGGLFGRS